ncbi:putative peroxisomal hydratase-dehydrogenase-epimerase protein [Phaeoacremonium minimum UCRPA7]|uniref:Putative peroxisomal hydratase-dehydrogenase-epimerase protein n=1 Tax=Phaeoacremonium minimum (strain UCR-PA7) TaxID=1286976 RepID=R8BGC9_PHAM7|nr:putative peroxisomal hydratase-dehydrogenase-epimerase protein [Phaeoacremonium minimum UCRPA7]EON98375.1 putative peroxisomal hydratase-dehydrogenase-epimerase protein [Phaeoacremonium minimum UCRPA7]
MAQLRFDNQVAIVTGAGGGLGKAHCLCLASRGASVIVNDVSSKAADDVVSEITAAGGQAVANYNTVLDGDAIIQSAIRSFGRLDILINNAGIQRHASFKDMTDKQWDEIDAVHVKGTFECTHAAWKIFRKQKYGRIIMTSSASGLFGDSGHCNYAAAKLGVYGLAETLAKEGVKNNIIVNAIAPIAASVMTATIMSTDTLQHLDPAYVSPLVAYLVHPSNKETGSVFEVGAGHVSKFRWERSPGAVLKCDETFTPGAILKRWADINDFSHPDHPINTANMMAHLEAAKRQGSNDPGEDIRYDGKVAVVTGAGAGLGRAYSIELGRRGAAVVVNDIADPDKVVREILAFGGKAVGTKSSVENGAAIIKTAIDNFGRVDILINNAGILRDKAFVNMTEKQWDDIISCHLRGTYSCTKAAYPYMLKQKYGRIVNTTSTSGIYGNFGQANYGTAKMAILGFSRALGREAAEHNIYVNTIAPSAGTELTRSVLSEELVKARRPEFVAPLVLALCSDKVQPNPTGGLYEVGCGWQGRTRWQRSGGVTFDVDKFTPEAISAQWPRIIDFEDGRADNPETPEEGLKNIMGVVKGLMSSGSGASAGSFLAAINAAKKAQPSVSETSYTEKEIILYNISLGATSDQLDLVYEGHPGFQVLPTYGVIIPPTATKSFNLSELVPNFSYKMVLHGEQYLEIRKWPIPTSARVRSLSKVVDVLDKGNAALIVTGTTTVDAETGEDLFYNETTLFVRGSGGFGGARNDTINGGKASATPTFPKRKHDLAVSVPTTKDQASLYRLNGDRNPLHIDPAVARAAGFKDGPILHGLCSFGLTGKAIMARYGPFKNIKMRFSGSVLPGQNLQVEIWREGQVVLFQTRVQETGKLCISGGRAELLTTGPKL